MKRRQLITSVVAGLGVTATSGYAWQYLIADDNDYLLSHGVIDPSSDSESIALFNEDGSFHRRMVDDIEKLLPSPLQEITSANSEEQRLLKDVNSVQTINKVRNFEHQFADDVFLSAEDKPVMLSLLTRLSRLQRLVGHGKFNVLGLDPGIRFARNYKKVGAFTPAELAFMEKLFDTQASDYGFYGDKISTNLSEAVVAKDLIKVRGSGHYLLKDTALAYYKKLTKDVGNRVILTSGVRSNIKQMHLFLSKAAHSEYNLSKASRSLAPPGHSFHGIGDFDVGLVGWGAKNFTSDFADTAEFKRMQDLGYVQIRYTADNNLGVRYEPWHIKVV